MSTWTNKPKFIDLLSQVNETFARVQRIQLLAKLLRAQAQLKTNELIAKEAKHGMGSSHS